MQIDRSTCLQRGVYKQRRRLFRAYVTDCVDSTRRGAAWRRCRYHNSWHTTVTDVREEGRKESERRTDGYIYYSAVPLSVSVGIIYCHSGTWSPSIQFVYARAGGRPTSTKRRMRHNRRAGDLCLLVGCCFVINNHVCPHGGRAPEERRKAYFRGWTCKQIRWGESVFLTRNYVYFSRCKEAACLKLFLSRLRDSVRKLQLKDISHLVTPARPARSDSKFPSSQSELYTDGRTDEAAGRPADCHPYVFISNSTSSPATQGAHFPSTSYFGHLS